MPGSGRRVSTRDPTKALWVRDGGTWKMVATLWWRDSGAWTHDPNYLIPTSPPTNFRVTSTSTDYNGVSLAWDWSGGPAVRNFIVKIYDYGGNPASVPDTNEVTLDPTARTYRVRWRAGPTPSSTCGLSRLLTTCVWPLLHTRSGMWAPRPTPPMTSRSTAGPTPGSGLLRWRLSPRTTTVPPWRRVRR